MTRFVASKLAVATALAGVLLTPEPAGAQFTYEIIHTFPSTPGSPQARLHQGTDGVLYGTTSEYGRMNGTVFALRPNGEGGFSRTILHEFDSALGSPFASVIQARDGDLYGTTRAGSVHPGSVFKVSPTGVFTTLHVFTGSPDEGSWPLAPLVQATDGSFYGTTNGGGANTAGTVFKITADGTLTTLYSFSAYQGEPGSPMDPLVQGADGNFYGIAGQAIFKITPDGTFTSLYTFTYPERRAGGLVEGTDGNFYGTTDVEGYSNAFKITPTGSLTRLHTFSEGEGFYSYDSLIQPSDGNFYGTLSQGGSGHGTVYKMTPAGDVTVLHYFDDEAPFVAHMGLIQARDGILYGVTAYGGPFRRGTVFSMDTAGGAFTTIHTFPESQEGCGPWSGLVQGSDGAFYGTTISGGPDDRGTVYRVTGDGTVTTLHSFTGSEGTSPMASLLRVSDGNFYGTTQAGGTDGWGTVYRMTPSGVVTVMHSFAGSDGATPWAPLIQVSDGNLHGTTSFGGSSNMGTLFRMSLSGDFVSYYSFNLPNSPVHPVGPLIQARDGFLYGTAYGLDDRAPYGGSVFRVTSGGIVLLDSIGSADHMTAGLTEGNDGNFYSTSFGAHRWPPEDFPYGQQAAGSIFKITPVGVKTLLHTFDGITFTEGVRPFNAPIEASDGNFYGTTHRYGGPQSSTTGSIYRVSPTGDFTTLKIMTDEDGTHPSGKLLQASDGAVYGVALGFSGCGRIFRFTLPQASSLPVVRSARHGHR